MRSRWNPRNLFFGWYIVAAGMVINMLIGGLVFHSFSFYVAELKAEYLWSASLFAFAFTLTRVESGVLGPIQGWLIDRFSPKTMIRWGVALTAVGMIAFSRLWDPGSFIGFYFLMSIGASVGGFMTISVVTVTWFERLRSRALGFMAMGFGLGGFFALGGRRNDRRRRMALDGARYGRRVDGRGIDAVVPLCSAPTEKGMEIDGGPFGRRQGRRIRGPDRPAREHLPPPGFHGPRGAAHTFLLGARAGARRAADGRIGDDGLFRMARAGDRGSLGCRRRLRLAW